MTLRLLSPRPAAPARAMHPIASIGLMILLLLLCGVEASAQTQSLPGLPAVTVDGAEGGEQTYSLTIQVLC
jgi:hypothetical protein